MFEIGCEEREGERAGESEREKEGGQDGMGCSSSGSGRVNPSRERKEGGRFAEMEGGEVEG